MNRMTDRQRFVATMHYQPRDRAPIMDFNFWDETLPAWHDQGLPDAVNRQNSDRAFGMDCSVECMTGTVGINSGLAPLFDEIVLEERADYEIAQQSDGVRVLRRKFMGSIPQPQAHLLQDRESWRTHYKPRLDPDHPDRFPADWEERVARWRDPERTEGAALPGGSLYGWIRNWMGLEQLSYVLYDDPAWFEEMVETVADCIVGTLGRILATGGRFEACAMWEDMCYNSGPLMSPEHVKRFLVPHYRRITDLLHRHDVDVVWLDCDGKIDSLIPLWLDAGVNCMFPLEVGTWGADPVALRREYGRDLLMMGGVDKHILARSPSEIEAEVQRLAPLIEEGGFIGFCDHRVPPDVPLANYLAYLDCVRRVWGHDIHLKPMQFEQMAFEKIGD